LSYSLSLLGAKFPRLPLDIVESTKQLQRFLRQWALVVYPQIDAAIATARSTGSRVDEINTASADYRYEI
jgi:hypothetical protein